MGPPWEIVFAGARTSSQKLRLSLRRRHHQILYLQGMKSMRWFPFVALAVGAAVTLSAQNRTPPRVPGIDTAGMDLSVRPQDDFARYVNGTWADKTPIPADGTTYGTFRMLR